MVSNFSFTILKLTTILILLSFNSITTTHLQNRMHLSKRDISITKPSFIEVTSSVKDDNDEVNTADATADTTVSIDTNNSDELPSDVNEVSNADEESTESDHKIFSRSDDSSDEKESKRRNEDHSSDESESDISSEEVSPVPENNSEEIASVPENNSEEISPVPENNSEEISEPSSTDEIATSTDVAEVTQSGTSDAASTAETENSNQSISEKIEEKRAVSDSNDTAPVTAKTENESNSAPTDTSNSDDSEHILSKAIAEKAIESSSSENSDNTTPTESNQPTEETNESLSNENSGDNIAPTEPSQPVEAQDDHENLNKLINKISHEIKKKKIDNHKKHVQLNFIEVNKPKSNKAYPKKDKDHDLHNKTSTKNDALTADNSTDSSQSMSSQLNQTKDDLANAEDALSTKKSNTGTSTYANKTSDSRQSKVEKTQKTHDREQTRDANKVKKINSVKNPGHLKHKDLANISLIEVKQHNTTDHEQSNKSDDKEDSHSFQDILNMTANNKQSENNSQHKNFLDDNNSTQTEAKVKDSLKNYSNQLNEDIENFENKTSEYINSLSTVFSSINNIKMLIYKSIFGITNSTEPIVSAESTKNNEDSNTLSALIQDGLEKFLTEKQNKNAKYYINIDNKLKTKTPLDKQSFSDVQSNKDYVDWKNNFIENHKQLFDKINEKTLDEEASRSFPEVIAKLKSKAPQAQKASDKPAN